MSSCNTNVPERFSATAIAAQMAIASEMLASFATDSHSRAKGLLYTKPHRGQLVLAPCHSVHTFGMRHLLDVAFVDAQGCVLEVHYRIGPCRLLRCAGAALTIERFSTGRNDWFAPGDRVGLAAIETTACLSE